MRNIGVLYIGVLTAGLCLGLWGCKDPVSYGNIPDAPINLIVYPNSIDNDLMAVGKHKSMKGGYMGVFVYHIGDMDEDFVAFEQACPVDWEDGCYVEFDSETGYLKGKQCQNTFSSSNGFGISIPRYALRKFKIIWLNPGSFRVTY